MTRAGCFNRSSHHFRTFINVRLCRLWVFEDACRAATHPFQLKASYVELLILRKSIVFPWVPPLRAHSQESSQWEQLSSRNFQLELKLSRAFVCDAVGNDDKTKVLKLEQLCPVWRFTELDFADKVLTRLANGKKLNKLNCRTSG